MYFKLQTIIILVVVILSSVGCSTKRQEALPDSTAFFTSRVNDEGVTEFAFGLAWDAPNSQSFFLGRRNQSAQLSHDSSGAWKIRMEERAVRLLRDKIDDESVCDYKHEINNVIWERNRVRLMGRCI